MGEGDRTWRPAQEGDGHSSNCQQLWVQGMSHLSSGLTCRQETEGHPPQDPGAPGRSVQEQTGHVPAQSSGLRVTEKRSARPFALLGGLACDVTVLMSGSWWLPPAPCTPRKAQLVQAFPILSILLGQGDLAVLSWARQGWGRWPSALLLCFPRSPCSVLCTWLALSRLLTEAPSHSHQTQAPRDALAPGKARFPAPAVSTHLHQFSTP